MAEVTREQENVNDLIKDIEERKIKCEEATIKMQTKTIEIDKLMKAVQIKEEHANIVMNQAKIIKEDVETSVRDNLDEKKIKAMQGIMNNPPEKIKLIVQAVNCLNPVQGQQQPNSWDGCKQLVMKSQQFCDGVKNFMDDAIGNGKNLKLSYINSSEG